VRADDDVARLAPAHGADHVAEAARHLLVAAAGHDPLQEAREPARLGRARRARAQLDLAAQQPEGGLAIEAVDGGDLSRGRAPVRLAVAGERQVVRGDERHERQPECHLNRQHDAQQLHRADCPG
jgi:hypothetical protein